MAAIILISSPPEVLTRILEYCDDFPQLLSLILTCKRLHSIWVANTSPILRSVCMTCMPAFNDALLAVRATNLVKESFLAGESPPNIFSVSQLGAPTHKLHLSELRDALNLQHLIKCIEHMFFAFENLWKLHPSEYSTDHENGRPTCPHELRIWRERFYRPMYRLFLAGALFYKAYNEPFLLAAEEGPGDFLQGYLRDFNAYRDTPEEQGASLQWPHSLSPQDIEYLTRFAVFDLNVDLSADLNRWDAVFGPFATWLIEEDEDRSSEISLSHFKDLSTRDASAFREIMLMLTAYNQLITRFMNGDGAWSLNRESQDEYANIPPRVPNKARSVSVVMFGVFRLEQITMPATVTHSTEMQLIANPLPRSLSTSQPTLETSASTYDPSTLLPNSQAVDISDVLESLYRNSMLPNHLNDYPAPPPPLQMFSYVLRKHFNLMFKVQAFEEYNQQPYEIFVQSAQNLMDSDHWHVSYGRELVEEYRPTVFSYREMT